MLTKIVNCPELKRYNNKYRRYSTISRGFFQKNLTDKMNSTYRRVNKKNKKKQVFFKI